uniref:Uncharacterized protein n=1 Tax=Mola mola TaxID=94237 RepID=A0A3Q3XFF5_MOLML
MKLGLLVVLAVAVLVPGPSDGRIVSRCELKGKLEHKLVQFRGWPQWFKMKVLSSEDDASVAIRTKRSLHHGTCQPFGFYGIFRLKDRYFCDSGLNPTRNRCHTHCRGESESDTLFVTFLWQHLSRFRGVFESVWGRWFVSNRECQDRRFHGRGKV